MTALLMFVVIAATAVLTLGISAVRTVSRFRLRHWMDYRKDGGGSAQRHLERPARLVQSAGTAAMLMVFTIGVLIASRAESNVPEFALDFVLFLTLFLLFGHLLPRSFGRRWAAAIVPVIMPLLSAVDIAVQPFNFIAWRVRRLVLVPRSTDDGEESLESLEGLLRDRAFDDVNTSEELAMISGVMQFGEKRVSDVMRPRKEIYAIPDGLDPLDLARRVSQSGYSRVPLYRDGPDDIVGMVHVIDIFKRRGESRPPLLPVTRTVQDRPANELLFELLRARRQLAVVRESSASDASVVGLVTLEDLLEELVGDIRDEHDDSTD